MLLFFLNENDPWLQGVGRRCVLKRAEISLYADDIIISVGDFFALLNQIDLIERQKITHTQEVFQE